jgi:hypothetical protein
MRARAALFRPKPRTAVQPTRDDSITMDARETRYGFLP